MTREERIAAIKSSSNDLVIYLDAMARQLLALAHPQADEAEVLDRLDRAFRNEPLILPRLASLAELAPRTAKSGRDYGAAVKEVAV